MATKEDTAAAAATNAAAQQQQQQQEPLRFFHNVPQFSDHPTVILTRGTETGTIGGCGPNRDQTIKILPDQVFVSRGDLRNQILPDTIITGRWTKVWFRAAVSAVSFVSGAVIGIGGTVYYNKRNDSTDAEAAPAQS